MRRRPAPDIALALALALLAAGSGQGAAAARAAPGGQAAPPPPPTSPAIRTDLPTLPPPDRTPSRPAAPFADFVRYAMAKAPPPPPGKQRESALIEQSSMARVPRRVRCREQTPAVLLDLDPGAQIFDLDDPPSPAAGLAAELARLRVSGMRVLWIAGLPQAAAPRLRTILRATELDPDGGDVVLLPRQGAGRKQLVRQAAARDWCIVAIAGDRRADFDEVFDYLRDPGGPAARMLEGNVGTGWFLTPLPIG